MYWESSGENEQYSNSKIGKAQHRPGYSLPVFGHVPYEVVARPSLQQEMRLMLAAGMRPRSLLRSATLNSATALGIADDYGSIELGKIADFVIVASNPLEEMAALEDIKAVVVDGNYLDRSALTIMSSG